MQLRIAGIADDSVVDGEGLRLTVFVQGCPRNCPGCHNPSAQSLTGGRLVTTEEIIKQVEANPLLTGVTFSGGEPFLQPEPLLLIARSVRAKGLDVWSYSGYTLEELNALNNPQVTALLAELDVLVDGEYLEALRDLSLKFRGSANQRVIDMKQTRTAKKIVLKY